WLWIFVLLNLQYVARFIGQWRIKTIAGSKNYQPNTHCLSDHLVFANNLFSNSFDKKSIKIRRLFKVNFLHTPLQARYMLIQISYSPVFKQHSLKNTVAITESTIICCQNSHISRHDGAVVIDVVYRHKMIYLSLFLSEA